MMKKTKEDTGINFDGVEPAVTDRLLGPKSV